MKKLKYVILFSIALAHISSFSQEKNIRFSALSVEDGLSQSSVFSVEQDKYGYIWLATFDGLNRYDGYTIKTFFGDRERPKSLPDSYVQSLKVDGSGNLWVGTNSQGLCQFQYHDESFLRVPLKTDSVLNGLTGVSVIAMDLLNDTTLIVVTEEGTNLVNTNSLECEFVTGRPELLERTGLVSYFNMFGDTVSCILIDSKGNRWSGTPKGLQRYIPGQAEITYTYRPYDLTSLSADEITCVFEDRGGVIWVGTSLGGVNKWDRSNEEVELFKEGKLPHKGINNGKIRCFYEDTKQDNLIWVGTVEGGLNLWDREKQYFSYWHTQNSNLQDNHIRDIEPWGEGYLIAMDGGGIQYFEKETMDFKTFEFGEIDTNTRVWDLHITGDSIWAATFDKGLYLKTGQLSRAVYTSSTQAVTCVSNTSDGTIWVGTFGEGIFGISKDNITHWTKDNSKLSDNRIYAIVPDQESNLWIGTKGGLNFMDSETKEFSNYTIADGLPNNTVMGVISKGGGDVWVSTNHGISHFNTAEHFFINYDLEDGLQNNEFLVHSFYTLRSGEMLFGGIDGYNIFPPTGLIDNTYKPQVVISQIDLEEGKWVSDTVLAVKNKINLKHHQNEFTLTFEALSYANSEKNKYSFTLEGFDKGWSVPGPRRFARYTNLPPGTYFFKVKAANNDGVWNETPATLQIVILPAFWQTWWFRIIILIAVTLSLFAIYSYRIKRIRTQNVRLEKEVILRTRQVVRQKTEIENKNKIIEGALDDIEDSLKYAKNIQSAMLPHDKEIQSAVNDAFVYFRPKEIVSGDFYWYKKSGDRIYFAVVDCTGHGVPGAFISIIGNDLLNQILTQKPDICTAEILNRLNTETIDALNQKEEDLMLRDGMDVALCCLHKVGEKKMLQFSGARNPVYLLRSKNSPPLTEHSRKIESDTHDLYIIKGESASIGIDFGVESFFTTKEFEVYDDDIIYMSSDGYADQFGGPKGKKFMYSRFRSLLLELNEESMENQRRRLDIILKEWKGPLEQIDDICVMGVKI